MDGNCIRKRGFTLLEVIISMTIISIVSVGIYTGYMIMIRETKDGQVKQAAALEGKKVAEALESTDFKIGGDSITAGNIIFNKNQAVYVRYLNKDYKDTEDDGSKVTESVAKYIESVTFTPSTAVPSITNTTSEAVSLNTNNNLNSGISKIYISRIGSQDYISYWKYDESKNYNPQTDEKSEISLLNDSEMELYVYLTDITGDSAHENVSVLDYTGTQLIATTKDINENLVINFSNYKNADGTLPSNENIQIDVYNQPSTVSNIYLEKQMDLNVDVEKLKGEVNIYNNRAENVSKDDIGDLYDIKIIITDNNTKNNLFTGYYKKNIHQ